MTPWPRGFLTLYSGDRRLPNCWINNNRRRIFCSRRPFSLRRRGLRLEAFHWIEEVNYITKVLHELLLKWTTFQEMGPCNLDLVVPTRRPTLQRPRITNTILPRISLTLSPSSPSRTSKLSGKKMASITPVCIVCTNFSIVSRCAEFHPTGRFFAVGSNSKVIRICQYQPEPLMPHQSGGGTATPPAVVISKKVKRCG